MTKKQIESAVNKAYSRNVKGAVVSVMDLGAIFGEVESKLQEGGDVDKAMQAAIAKYRKN